MGEVGVMHHPIPDEMPRPDDCDNNDLGLPEQDSIQDSWDDFDDAWDAWWDGYDNYYSFNTDVLGNIFIAGAAVATAIAACTESLGAACLVFGGAAAEASDNLGDAFQSHNDLSDSLTTIDPGQDSTLLEDLNDAFNKYKDRWDKYGCGDFPYDFDNAPAPFCVPMAGVCIVYPVDGGPPSVVPMPGGPGGYHLP